MRENQECTLLSASAVKPRDHCRHHGRARTVVARPWIIYRRRKYFEVLRVFQVLSSTLSTSSTKVLNLEYEYGRYGCTWKYFMHAGRVRLRHRSRATSKTTKLDSSRSNSGPNLIDPPTTTRKFHYSQVWRKPRPISGRTPTSRGWYHGGRNHASEDL